MVCVKVQQTGCDWGHSDDNMSNRVSIRGTGNHQASEVIKYPVITRGRAESRAEGKTDRVSYLIRREQQQSNDLYQRIEQINAKQEGSLHKYRHQKQLLSYSPRKKVIHANLSQSAELCRGRTHSPTKQEPEYIGPSIQPLAIDTTPTTKVARREYQRKQLQLFRKSMYRSKSRQLEGITVVPPKGRHIQDYLSVEKVAIKDVEGSMIGKARIMRQHRLDLLVCSPSLTWDHSILERQDSADLDRTSIMAEPPSPVKPPKPVKFKVPFEVYFYRDFIWKVGFSNELIVSPPESYDTKVKVHVGRGNNGKLIKGLLKRRPWTVLVDKVQEAHFVWTQLKVNTFFGMQKVGSPPLPIAKKKKEEDDEQDRPKIKQMTKNKILNEYEQQLWKDYWIENIGRQNKAKQSLKKRTKLMEVPSIEIEQALSQIKIHNHLSSSFVVGNKKALFRTMSEYYKQEGKDVFEYLPLTFHLTTGLEDDQYLHFLQHFYAIAKQNRQGSEGESLHNAWIIKPGENTNRGNGIRVCQELSEIKALLKTRQKHNDGTVKTYILQKYIERPLLYKRRKFDLRHFVLLTCSNGIMKGYWYKEGYVRTTSSEFSLKGNSGAVHLTNDAVQKQLPDYGKYEKANKASYDELNAAVRKVDQKFNFYQTVYPTMKKIATDILRAAASKVDPHRRRNNFELLGLDFMVDASYKVWLIQANTNPCYETNCQLLHKIIPSLLEDTLELTLDTVFPAPLGFAPKSQVFTENTNLTNKYELVFDERVQQLSKFLVNTQGVEEEDEDVFEDDGEDFCEQHS